MQLGNLSQKDDVLRWLKKFKSALTSKSTFYIINREETLKTLSELGLTKRNLRNILLRLSIENYCSGPNPDYNSTEKGAIWIFGIKEYGMMIYIKLKIAYAYNHEIAKCLSFHPAEYSLNFPYK